MMRAITDKSNHQRFIGIIFILAGLGHFVMPQFYMQIMPPFIPLHFELVLLSGVFELLGGIGMFLPKFRRWAGYGLILLLFAVFPANIYMALTPDILPEVPQWAALLRLPLQFVLMGWILWAIRE